MTHAELIEQRMPELTAATMLDLAKGWYDRTHPQADAETASTAAKLTAWLAAEVEDADSAEAAAAAAAREPESTIVTTLQVTHIVRGTADPGEALAQQIAQTAARCAWAGYHEHVLHGGHPDDISIGSVQVFTREAEEAAATPEGGEA